MRPPISRFFIRATLMVLALLAGMIVAAGIQTPMRLWLGDKSYYQLGRPLHEAVVIVSILVASVTAEKFY